jgi:hypothetical protein
MQWQDSGKIGQAKIYQRSKESVDRVVFYPDFCLILARTPAHINMVAEAEIDAAIERRIPANGHIGPAALEFLVEKIPADRIVRKIDAMLKAETPQGNPDWRAQSDAVKLWLSYVIGLPIQRQHIIQEKISTPAPDKLLENPVAVETLFRLALATEAGKAALAKVAAESTHDT